MSKHDEWLAAYLGDTNSDLAHFNEKHDSKGRFAKKTGGAATASNPKQPPKGSHTDLLSLYGMSVSKIPRSAFRYGADPRPVKDEKGGYNKSDRNRIRSDIVAKMTSSMLGQLTDTGSWFDPKNSKYARYGNDLISATSNNASDPNLNRSYLKQALTKELLTAYKANVASPALRIQDEEDEAELELLIRNAVDSLVEKEISRRGRDAMASQMNREKSEAARAESKKGAKITLKDRIATAYKEASNANANRPSASVQTLKVKLGSLVDKVGASAKSGKGKTSALVAKGKKYLDSAFTSTKTTFNTQAEKLKQKKKSRLTKTEYDTSSYKNL